MAHQQESFHLFPSRQSLSCFLTHMAKRVHHKAARSQKAPSMAAAPGFKSQHQSSFAAPFPTPSTISYTCKHSCILPTVLCCHSKSGQAWPQLFNISVKPVKGYRYVKWPCQRLSAKLLVFKTTLNGLTQCVPSSSSDLWGWGHAIYFFLIFSGHPEFWTPLQIPTWAPHLGCTLSHSISS